MKPNRIIAGALVALGFGSTLGLAGGCAPRASKSAATDAELAADSVILDVHEPGMRVMYGVAPVRFDPNKPIPERGVRPEPQPAAEPSETPATPEKPAAE